MVLVLTPRGNETHPCLGLEDRHFARPPQASPAYAGVGLAFFGIFAFALVCTTVQVWRMVDHPRFAKVRPLALSLSALVADYLYVSGGTIAIALEWPCVYMILAQIVGIGIIATTLMLRCIVICLEAQYATLVSAQRVVKDEDLSTSPALTNKDNNKDDAASTSQHAPSTSRGAPLSATASLHYLARQYHAATLLFRLISGYTKLATFTLPQVLQARAGYGLFAFLYFSPALITALVVVLVSPQVRECNGSGPQACHEVFLEMEMALMMVLAYFIVFDAGMIVLAYRMSGSRWDSKGVLREIALVVGFAGLAGLVAVMLAVIDPGDADFNRQFSWQCVVFFPGMLYLYVTFWAQFRAAWRQDRVNARENKAALQSEVITQMAHILEQSAELRAEFEAFAKRQYISESVTFLADVSAFKLYFYGKAATWRTQKVHMLVKNYIQVGAALEVNISAGARARVLERVWLTEGGGGMGKLDTDMIDVFDEAVREVKAMVQTGAWREFSRGRDLDALLAPSASPPPGGVTSRLGGARTSSFSGNSSSVAVAAYVVDDAAAA